MSIETERKFLVKGEEGRHGATCTRIRQSFLAIDSVRTVRVRVVDDKGFLTIKGRSTGISREEYEYEIPHDDAPALLSSICLPQQIEKVRYAVGFGSHIWEVDVFEGKNAGLIVAEIELSDANERFDLPAWAGTEVSHDLRYFKANLMLRPYSTW